jgi:prepilin-type N-terminal cleavage/methylation domain-containing protein
LIVIHKQSDETGGKISMFMRMPHGGRRHRRAFTLIELLVVVSIIVLLVAILLPSLAKARQQAKRVVCASNHHQLITGLLVYASENNGYVPPSVPAFNASLTWIVRQLFSAGPQWIHLGILHRYRQIPEPQTYFCPSYTEFPHCWPRGWYEFSAYFGKERVATSYIYVINGQLDQYPKGCRPNARLYDLKREALFADIFIGNPSKSQRKGVWPHFGGINASFADGSTQLMRVRPQLAVTAAVLYEDGDTDTKDYFTWCVFRLLSGEPAWINAFPVLPPGVE